jgi:hypothetical protein
MILKIAAVMLLVILAVLLFAASKPNTLSMQRSITINAPPEKIFALINDLHTWKDWDRDDQEDTTITRVYGGPATGVGASCEWDSRGRPGKGRMLIIESQASDHVAVKVDFVKPFESHNLNVFSLAPSGNGTVLTWSWQGQNLYFMKVMGVFASMDKMIGSHFESGLRNLKTLAEK